ncbi:hypothetical protein DFH08DRAFT_274161 [Mycena albidolilacea]|uniref:Gag protein n=1 Tax=Mycena albidolilacea TaxID=1033008 RepID=A0AAD7AP81_9AGAR|nr:hypothetical protein DFH08DRAFT_274161 [Mycena albidolilacea]
MSNHNTVYTEVEHHSSRPPVLTKGDITPLVARDFENAALNWFVLKNVQEASQVANILGCFRDMRHIAWLRPNAEHARVMKLSFNNFMTEFRGKYLPVNWQAVTWNEILSSCMKDTQTFDEYFTDVVGLGSLLDGTPAALDHTRLRHTLEAGMCADLEIEYRLDTVANAIAHDKMDEWCCEVRRIDERRIHDIAKQHCIAAEIHKVEKQKAASDGDRNPKKPFSFSAKGNTSVAATAAPSTPSAAAPKGCPKLTEGERALLNEHEGCNKCRKFYASHHSKNCTNDFPDAASYRTLTAEDAAARRQEG